MSESPDTKLFVWRENRFLESPFEEQKKTFVPFPIDLSDTDDLSDSEFSYTYEFVKSRLEDEHLWPRELKLDVIAEFFARCPYCKTISPVLKADGIIPQNIKKKYENFLDANQVGFECKLCGWEWTDNPVPYSYGFDNVDLYSNVKYKELRSFDINDNNLAIEELGSFLKKNYNEIYKISPRKFEEIVNSIYKNLGFRTILTKSTRDRGADIILRENNNKIIIECKKYSEFSKVGIAHVQRLMGAMISFKAKSAKLITTSYFSTPAKETQHIYTNLGLDLELLDAYDLLKLLDLYNNTLPPLDKIDPQLLIENNYKSLKNSG